MSKIIQSKAFRILALVIWVTGIGVLVFFALIRAAWDRHAELLAEPQIVPPALPTGSVLPQRLFDGQGLIFEQFAEEDQFIGSSKSGIAISPKQSRDWIKPEATSKAEVD